MGEYCNPIATSPCSVTDGSGESSTYPCACGAAICSTKQQCSSASSQCLAFTFAHSQAYQGSTVLRFERRTLANGVRAWTDREYVFKDLHIYFHLSGYEFFAGPHLEMPPGKITVSAPPGLIAIWGENKPLKRDG